MCLCLPSGASVAPGHPWVRCALVWLWGAWAHPVVSPQKLLEECEQHKDKVEECQRYAKQYIDAIKVCPQPGGWAGCGAGEAAPCPAGGGILAPCPAGGLVARSRALIPLSWSGLRAAAGELQGTGGAGGIAGQEAQSAVGIGQHHPGGEEGSPCPRRGLHAPGGVSPPQRGSPFPRGSPCPWPRVSCSSWDVAAH